MSTNSADHGFFSKERITAPPGFNRWMIPPAALAVHLCIGQAYAFSVFNNPMTKLLGITQSAPNDWDRSEERRVGKECVSTCRSRWSPYHAKKNRRTEPMDTIARAHHSR